MGVEEMNACGLIVEYNPFHNGHVYHLEEAKKTTAADCVVAVMSGSFLQRGEPAIIDKFHRTKAALNTGIDVVLELPYVYAVQHSDIFATGAVKTLYEFGVNSVCFGSESGSINSFLSSYHTFKAKSSTFNHTLKYYLDAGNSFPEASTYAYKEIGLTDSSMDLSKPNNILGYSYVKAIMENKLPIEPLTIKRKANAFHDENITGTIASATSIRKELMKQHTLTSKITDSLPGETVNQLQQYVLTASHWHDWERYFPLLHYRVMTMSKEELATIQGVDEGIENRIKATAKIASSFQNWVEAIKTKRYTWTRIQRMFVHILTNTKKTEIEMISQDSSVPYVRVIGLTNNGRNYLNQQKKQMNVPIVSSIGRNQHNILSIEEKVSNTYYSILPPKSRQKLFKQELQAPIIL